MDQLKNVLQGHKAFPENYATGSIPPRAVSTQGGINSNVLTLVNGVARWSSVEDLIAGTGVTGVPQGGTGISSYNPGDLIVAVGPTTLSRIPAIGGRKALFTDIVGVPPNYRSIVAPDVISGTFTGVTWHGSVIVTTYTEAKVIDITGTANRITIGGTATHPTVDIHASYVGQSSIITVGTITTGIWHGSVIAEIYGGTNQSTYAKGDLLYASAVNTLGKLALAVTDGWVLTVNSGTGLPEWRAPSGGGGAVAWADLPVSPGTWSIVGNATFDTGFAGAYITILGGGFLLEGSITVGYGLTTENSSNSVNINCGTNGGANNKDAQQSYLSGSSLYWTVGILGSVATDFAYRIRNLTGTPADALRIDITTNAITFASYLGQSSIVTVGTITSGIWNAGAVTSSSTITATTEFVGPSLDSGGAVDLILQRNNVTKITVGNALVTFVDPITTSAYQVSSVQVVGARATGWTVMTGTTDKATSWDTESITLNQLARRMKAVQEALTTHGLVGA